MQSRRGVGTNVPLTRVQGDNDTIIVLVDDVTRVLHQEPGTPFVSGGFDSPAMASPEARRDQVRGTAQDRGVERQSSLSQSTQGRQCTYKGRR